MQNAIEENNHESTDQLVPPTVTDTDAFLEPRIAAAVIDFLVAVALGWAARGS